MASIKKSGEVYTTVDSHEVLIGTVGETPDGEGSDLDGERGAWLSQCTLTDRMFYASKRGEAVDLLEDHFLRTHTTAM